MVRSADSKLSMYPVMSARGGFHVSMAFSVWMLLAARSWGASTSEEMQTLVYIFTAVMKAALQCLLVWKSSAAVCLPVTQGAQELRVEAFWNKVKRSSSTELWLSVIVHFLCLLFSYSLANNKNMGEERDLWWTLLWWLRSWPGPAQHRPSQCSVWPAPESSSQTPPRFLTHVPWPEPLGNKKYTK